jgi:hypothetical protein
MRVAFLWILAFEFSFVVLSCSNSSNTTAEKAAEKDSVAHGYNELANPDSMDSFVISDYNRDNPEIDSIDRPEISKVVTDLDTTFLFQIWASDLEGPHADFQISAKYFFVVDYDGDGDMPYELVGRKLKVYYNDFVQEGEILALSPNELRIRWKGMDLHNVYRSWDVY